MTKLEFLDCLRKKLSGLPQKDIAERLAFYEEMINDRMEDGLSEEDAVGQIGDMDTIAEQIITESADGKGAKDGEGPKRKNTWTVALLVLGAPLWMPLLIAAFAVVAAVYAVLWSVVACLWAVEIALWGTALGGLVAGVAYLFGGNIMTGTILLGASAVSTGLFIFLLYGCKAAVKGTWLLTKRIAVGVKKCFVKKEETA